MNKSTKKVELKVEQNCYLRFSNKKKRNIISNYLFANNMKFINIPMYMGM